MEKFNFKTKKEAIRKFNELSRSKFNILTRIKKNPNGFEFNRIVLTKREVRDRELFKLEQQNKKKIYIMAE